MVASNWLVRLVLAMGLGTGVLTGSFSVSLAETLARTDRSPSVVSAKLAVESARRNLDRLSFAGDFSVTASPQGKATTEFSVPFPEQTIISGTVALKVPVGLSDSARLQVEQAKVDLRLAEDRLAQARAGAYAAVYGLYMQAWLAQEEQAVLQAELKAARAYAGALQEQFRLGKVSLVEVISADEDLRRKENAASRGELAHRLSWLKLSTEVGLAFTPDTPRLDPDPALSTLPDLPTPPALVSWALGQNVDVRTLTTSMMGLQDRIALLRKPNLSPTVQLSGGIADHSLTFSYGFDQPQVSASYTIPFFSEGTIPGSNANNLTNTWNVGLGLSLAFTSEKADSLEATSLEVLREQEAARLDALRQTLQLDIRSRYQGWLSARQDLDQAEASVTRSEANKAIVDSRRSLGLVSDYEVLQANALLARAEYAVRAAEAGTRVRFLETAQSAGYLSQVISEFEKGAQQ